MDIVCPVTVVLGTARLTVRQCLALRPQSVVPMKESAGEDLQILVNGCLIARGEVIIVEDSAGARVTSVPGDLTEEA
jgi:flagellar motor switch protein FliN/FliY